MIREAIVKIVSKGDLTYDEAYTVMNEIMSGETTPTQNAAFLAALSTKSTKAETIAEISGCAEAMREHATPVEHPGMEVLEIVGTGGDNSNSFNISTTAAFIIAAAGIPVAKHGNRAASSLSGTADLQEALGVNISQDPDKARELLEKAGISVEKLIVDENVELARSFDLKMAPTLIVTDGENYEKYAGVQEIKAFISSVK
jgi:anthranilate phosphoribosyltransferase